MRVLRCLLVPGVLLATAALVVVSGCGDPRGTSGSAGQGQTCTSCHGGSENDTGAPPRGLRGSAADGTAAPGVGAHTAHVTAGLFSVAFTCTDCHPDPRFGSPSHHDGQVQMAFGSRATAGGSVAPVFDPNTRACSNTYCHGGFPGGNVSNTPRWNTVDGTQVACGTCHGLPPPSPHPQNTSCGSCHAGYSTTTVNVTTHVNGVVDVGGLGCSSCHGDAARLPEPFEPLVAAAPPAGTRGEQAPSSRAVGSHQRHLGAGSLATGFTCRECHRVPSSLAHSDGNVDMAWGVLATTGGAGPQWNGATCSNTYCHGNFRGGNASYAPEWTRPATTACGTCHGTPPAAPHPQATSCGSCHPGYGATSVNPATHVNGVIEVAGLTCTSCHGDPARAPTALNPQLPAAPPAGSRGESSTSERAVGAHQLHLGPGAVATGVACRECHAVPTSPAHANGLVDVIWGPLATNRGAAPLWDGARCSNTYCHGSFRGGNPTYAPDWTRPAATTCGTCHGVPPAAPHPQNPSCGSCHGGYTATSVDRAKHLNGFIDLDQLTCSSCHGDASRLPASFEPLVEAAPPQGTHGEQAPSDRAVGAHQQHLGAGTLASGFACRECHAVPSSLAHANGSVEMAWGAIATTAGAGPQWSGTTCSNTYCHGSFRGGNVEYAPTWTRASATPCGSCHGLPPATPHPQNAACGNCHPGYGPTSVNRETHVNGTLELGPMACSSCHGDPSRPATQVNPQLAAAPPTGSRGETLPSTRAVGAHQLHLGGGALGRELACGECHQVPTSLAHVDGNVQLSWGLLATAGGATPRWDGATCSNTYCHGSFAGGNRSYAPTWTQPAQIGCGTCHALPPPAPHPANPSCGGCHVGYGNSSVNTATHLNGVVEVNLTCSSCHGDPARAPTPLNPQLAAAPPYGTRGETHVSDRSVGAHQLHLGAGALGGAVACTECHALPPIAQHSNGRVDLVWGPISTTQNANPAWDTATNRCSNTYCHGRFNGGNSYAPDWTHPAAASQLCGTCHGVPPPSPHPSSTQCGGCHAGYSATTVNTALHVNGAVELTLTCTSCHGDPARPPTAANPQIAVAPPVGTRGETATSDRGVGAHQRHLATGPLTNGVACRECHQLPASMQHPNGAVDLAWGALATQGNVSPVWDGSTCSNTYCHGAFPGGSAYAPQWTRPAASACGSCHGVPPPAPHPPNSRCGGCHEGYSDTTANPAKHVNGTVDVAGLTCSSCHGDATRLATSKNPQLPAAPPYGTRGEALTSDRAVGAHQRHLNAGPAGAAIACNECHVVPTSMAHATGAVELSWGPLATTGGLQPAWNGITCSNTYCHGGFRNGNATYAPQWTAPSADACGTCHGLPPGGTHPKSVSCGGCHGGYGTATVNVTDHLDGRVELLPMACTSCHGDGQRVAVAGADLNVKVAPPSTATARSPGAHDAHDNRSAVTSPPIGCAACHQGTFDFSTALGPEAIGNHPTGTLVVSFGGRAAGPGADAGGVVWSRSIPAPSYDPAATTCSSTYCHGNYAGTFTYSRWDYSQDAPVSITASFSGGAAAPTWTGGPTTCESCHGNPPANGGWHAITHPVRDCYWCHPGATGSSGVGTAITVPSRHVDGTIDVQPQWRSTCFTCH